MKKLLFIIISIVFIFTACSKDKDVNITVKFTGIEYDGTIDVYLGIADGGAYNTEQFNKLKIRETIKITPSVTEQSHTFKVPAKETYTPFIFHDLNKNGKYDENETVRLAMTIVYVEEDKTAEINYNY